MGGLATCGLSRQVTRQMQQARKATATKMIITLHQMKAVLLRLVMCVEIGARQPEFTACSVALQLCDFG